jgi:hypothetical protein
MAFSYTNVDKGTDGSTSNVVTFSALNLGTPSSDRILQAILTDRVNQTGASYSSVTIAGVTATQVTNAQITSGDNALIGDAWYAAVPTGTSGNVVVTLSTAATSDRMQCALYALTGSQSSPSSAVTATSTTDNPSFSISVPAGGGSAEAFMNRGGIVDSMSWTNATQDYYTSVTGSGGSSDCSAAHTTSTGSVTVTASTASTGSSSILVGVAWAPAAGPPPPSAPGIFVVSEW